MLRSIKKLKNYKLEATNGQIGRCKDFLFDDEHWTVRYMVADTGGWLTGKRVLISPALLGSPDWSSGSLAVGMTREQIEAAPSIDEDKPVSRQHELQMSQFYGYAPYWGGPAAWGWTATPYTMGGMQPALPAIPRDAGGDPHLRSVREVTGYGIEASDGDIGHVEDFVVDDETWTLRYVVIDTRNWLPGREVLISPSWVRGVDWSLRKVTVDMTKQQIKDSPDYDAGLPINREYEARLYDFYGRPHYWQSEQQGPGAFR